MNTESTQTPESLGSPSGSAWEGIDADTFVRSVRDGTYDPHGPDKDSIEVAKYCEGSKPEDYCPEFGRNWGQIDRGLDMAAMNGTGTEFKPLKYCPWCGGLLEARANFEPNI